MKRRLFSRGNDAARPGEDVTTSLRPAPPIAKRLNRNALTVAAVVMGMTVLTAIVVVSPSKAPSQTGALTATTDEAPPAPPRPSFLDQPARVPPATASVPVVPTVPSMPVSPAPSPSTQTPAVVHSPPSSYSGPYDTEARTTPSLRDPSSTAGEAAAAQRERSYQAALASSVVVGGVQASAQSGAAAQRPTLAMQEEQLISLGDSVLRASMQSNGNGAKSLATSSEPSNGPPSANEQRASFSDRAAKSVGALIVAQLEPAGTGYALRAGTVIPGLLITSISSELPGEIVGQVSRDVYDSRTQRTLLIPKGSRLIGSYDNQVAAGQGRLLVAWTRLLLPDGRSMRLPGLAVADRQGNAGAKGSVDNHWRRVFGNALLLSAIGAGVQLSQPAQASVLSAPSAGQVAAGAVGQELSSVALEILRRGMDVKPTISIPSGQPFNVLLSGDLLFDEPYTPHG
jgi:type IV secretory pathway VirB10-like protein